MCSNAPGLCLALRGSHGCWFSAARGPGADTSGTAWISQGSARRRVKRGSTRAISPDYFAAIGMRVLRGRASTAEDDAGAPDVAVINEFAAPRFFAGRDAVGAVVRFNGASPDRRRSTKLADRRSGDGTGFGVLRTVRSVSADSSHGTCSSSFGPRLHRAGRSRPRGDSSGARAYKVRA